MIGVDKLIYTRVSGHDLIKYYLGDNPTVKPYMTPGDAIAPSITYEHVSAAVPTAIPGYEILQYRIDIWASTQKLTTYLSEAVKDALEGFPYSNQYSTVYFIFFKSTADTHYLETGINRRALNLEIKARKI